jgi:hypothetical protein
MIKKDERVKVCSIYGTHKKCNENVHHKLVWKRRLRRHMHTQKDNTKMDLKEIGLDGMDWIHLAQDRNQ